MQMDTQGTLGAEHRIEAVGQALPPLCVGLRARPGRGSPLLSEQGVNRSSTACGGPEHLPLPRQLLVTSPDGHGGKRTPGPPALTTVGAGWRVSV